MFLVIFGCSTLLNTILKEPELFYAVYLDLCYMGIGVYAEKENC